MCRFHYEQQKHIKSVYESDTCNDFMDHNAVFRLDTLFIVHTYILAGLHLGSLHFEF